ncbi:MAG: hypothetical protein EKK31_01600 [Hyphomicrobiales bacterium]|nr:MAG: hypothetical protein EKK31_01600 [Hyphomicrobiales bacterium]
MHATLSPKHLFVLLLTVFLTAGFSLSAATASIMPTMAKVNRAMFMPADVGMGKMMAGAMSGDCKACLKGVGSSDSPIHCPPTCITPVLAVLPQDLTVAMVSRTEEPLALRAPFLRGRTFLPDPLPPRPSE